MRKTICYYSFFKEDISKPKQQALIEEIKKNNLKQNVRGVLIIWDNMFFQIIEGKYNTVENIYRKIKRDHRHKNIVEVINRPIKYYSFSNFYAGYSISNNMQTLYDIQKYIDIFDYEIIENENIFYDLIENLLLESA